MKKALVTLSLLAVLTPLAWGQKYNIQFVIPTGGRQDSVMYIGQHYRDGFIKMDSATLVKEGTYTFKGRRKWPKGIYSLIDISATRSWLDFTIDDSQVFTFRLTSTIEVADPQKDIVGSAANQAMYTYKNRFNDATKRARDIEKRRKSSDVKVKEEAEHDLELLNKEMEAFEKPFINANIKYRFFQLTKMFMGPEVPDEVEDKALYYRMHYWDDVDLKDHSLVYTPDLFNKMNYFFYGMLYHADSDTICREIDRLAARIGNDTALLRYVFDHIEPRYFRSTRNIGWDAVWCHLAGEYYLKGRCPWATEGTLHNIRYNYNRIKQSLIGAHGQELLMLDTTQIDAPEHWKSSHQFPTKYVILWFWDPDCHHCQAQSAELKVLYDSLQTAPDRRFEVYAVGYESDVAKWKNYVKEHDFRWVNVGGQNVNIDYQEAYNVHGAPTMIILNEKRDIIMNKVLPIKGLLQFLDNYEKTRK